MYHTFASLAFPPSPLVYQRIEYGLTYETRQAGILDLEVFTSFGYALYSDR